MSMARTGTSGSNLPAARIPSAPRTLILGTAIGVLVSITVLWSLKGPPEAVHAPLRAVSATIATTVLSVAGEPVELRGFAIAGPGHVLHVDAGCSGSRKILLLGILALVLAMRRGLGPKASAILVLASLALALASNATRLLGLFVLGSRFHPLHPLVHEATGLLPFVAAAMLVFAVATRMERRRTGARP